MLISFAIIFGFYIFYINKHLLWWFHKMFSFSYTWILANYDHIALAPPAYLHYGGLFSEKRWFYTLELDWWAHSALNNLNFILFPKFNCKQLYFVYLCQISQQFRKYGVPPPDLPNTPCLQGLKI